MRKLVKGGRRLLLFVMLATIAVGCMPSVANPGWTTLSVQGDTVYAALATGRVVALKASDGSDIWSYPLERQQSNPVGCSLPRLSASEDTVRPLDAVYGTPTLTDKLVLIGSFDRYLYAFDRATGRSEWKFSTQGAVIGSATVYEGVSYFASLDRSVYAVNATTHELTWESPLDGSKRTDGSSWGAPAVDTKRVYVGSMDHTVYALDRATGKEVWHKDIGGSVPGSLTLVDSTVLVGGVDKELHALKADDGSELWVRPLDHWMMGEATVVDGYAYVGTLGGKVYAYRVADGSALWEGPVVLSGAVRAAPVKLGEDLIVATDASTLYRIDPKTGGSSVFFKSTGAVLSAPVVVGNVLYVGTTAGNVQAIDGSRKEGQQLWIYPPAKK